MRFDDTIDVNRNKRGFIESVYRNASASDVRATDANKKKKKKEEKRRKRPNRGDEGGTIEGTMKIVDRRENDRYEVFFCFVI